MLGGQTNELLEAIPFADDRRSIVPTILISHIDFGSHYIQVDKVLAGFPLTILESAARYISSLGKFLTWR